MNQTPTSLALLLGTSLALTATAGPQSFDFKDPKGVNNAAFRLDAPLESVSGTANGVTGTITFDSENPATLHGEQWLDSKKHSEIAFESTKVSNVKTAGTETTADVTGKFTLRGVTEEITVPVKLTYLKDKLGAHSNGQMQGDLLVVRSKFTIKRSDYDINPGAPSDI
jgi:polyisoprenoid-binding protein YceI